jgi:hypothetical protein
MPVTPISRGDVAMGLGYPLGWMRGDCSVLVSTAKTV